MVSQPDWQVVRQAVTQAVRLSGRQLAMQSVTQSVRHADSYLVRQAGSLSVRLASSQEGNQMVWQSSR